MSDQIESMGANDRANGGIAHGAVVSEGCAAHGRYHVQCFDGDGRLKWEDDIENVVCTEGKNAMLTHALKGSSYTSVLAMGLISDDNYTTPPAAANTAANITTASGSPPNGWNEAPSGIASARQTPSLGSASAGAISTSANVDFSIGGTDTIKGCFVLMRDAGGTAPTTTVGNNSGAIYSAGLFSGGDKAVGNGDTLRVSSYSTNLNA